MEPGSKKKFCHHPECGQQFLRSCIFCHKGPKVISSKYCSQECQRLEQHIKQIPKAHRPFCPEFLETGRCPKGDQCWLPHRKPRIAHAFSDDDKDPMPNRGHGSAYQHDYDLPETLDTEYLYLSPDADLNTDFLNNKGERVYSGPGAMFIVEHMRRPTGVTKISQAIVRREQIDYGNESDGESDVTDLDEQVEFGGTVGAGESPTISDGPVVDTDDNIELIPLAQREQIHDSDLDEGFVSAMEVDDHEHDLCRTSTMKSTSSARTSHRNICPASQLSDDLESPAEAWEQENTENVWGASWSGSWAEWWRREPRTDNG